MAAGTSAAMAKVAQCKTLVPTFDAQRATVSEMKEYAGCVDTLYPSEISGDVVVVFKVLFAIALVGLAVGAWRGRDYGFECAAVGGVIGFIMAPVAVAFAGGVMLGAVWLFQ